MKLITKRKLTIFLCLCVIVVFTACQKADKTGTPSLTDATTSEASSNHVNSAFSESQSPIATETKTTTDTSTQTISTIMGDVTVPLNPTKIVALGNPGDLVAMGIKPIAGDNKINLFDGLLTEDSYTYITSDDYEGIMALGPDLILIASTPAQADYERLTAIAPTVVTEAYSTSLSDRITFVGKVIGKEAEAKKALSDFESQAEAYKAQLIKAGIENKTITVMEGTYLFGDKYGRGADIVYNYLGFRAPDKLQEVFSRGDMYLEVSMEVLPQYCGDYILSSVWDGSEDLSQNAVWNSIPAVKDGHVIKIDFSDYFSRDLYTSGKQMKMLVEALLALK
jgi:iron complex transport system substrate-binding protein